MLQPANDLQQIGITKARKSLMGEKRADGYKFSETAFGKFLANEKKREGKYNVIVIVFAVLFGGPMIFLTLSLLWKGLAWCLSFL
jgi:hypothetical protein